MRKILATTVALAAVLAFTAPAFAQEVVGVIKTYDNGTRVLILEDGTRYTLSEGVTIQRYKPGMKVRYVVEERGGGQRYITKIITED